MASYGFSFRASTRRDGGQGSLYLRVVHGGESRSVTTPHKIMPEEWDAIGRRVRIPIGRSGAGQDTARQRQLVDIESSMMCDLHRMEGVIRKLERTNKHYSVDDVMTRYRTMVSGSTLVAFTEKLAASLEHEGRYRTAAAYRTAVARLCCFSGEKDLNYSHITMELLSAFQKHLKAQGRNMNTISFYMRTLRAIYNKAVAEGVIHRHGENLFAGVYTGVSPTRKRALSPGDLAVLSAFDPAAGNRAAELPESLTTALAIFLFCYHARGMCFVDMAHLRKSDIRGDVIRYRRAKTGQPIELFIVPEMRAIIDWFAPRVAGSRYVFPIITDSGRSAWRQYESGLRMQNMRLKRVAAICGVSGRLTTHVARHSWATVAKSMGVPLAVISEGLGHSNQRTTEIYLASLERSMLDYASRVVSGSIRPENRPGNRPGNRPENENRRRAVKQTSAGGMGGFGVAGGEPNIWAAMPPWFCATGYPVGHRY